MDETAARIRSLLVDACLLSQPAPVLMEVRAELLALADATLDGEAADDACELVAEIDAVLDRSDAASGFRRAS